MVASTEHRRLHSDSVAAGFASAAVDRQGPGTDPVDGTKRHHGETCAPVAKVVGGDRDHRMICLDVGV